MNATVVTGLTWAQRLEELLGDAIGR